MAMETLMRDITLHLDGLRELEDQEGPRFLCRIVAVHDFPAIAAELMLIYDGPQFPALREVVRVGSFGPSGSLIVELRQRLEDYSGGVAPGLAEEVILRFASATPDPRSVDAYWFGQFVVGYYSEYRRATKSRVELRSYGRIRNRRVYPPLRRIA